MRAAIAIILVTSLWACTSSPGNLRYYQFNFSNSESQPGYADLRQKEAITFSLTVPDYLKQNKMVIQVDYGELQFSQLHLWAQLPAKAIHSQIRDSINQFATDWHVISGNHSVRQESRLRLHINLSHFYSTASGKVIMAGEWLFSVDEKPQAKSNFNYEKVLTEDGYGAALSAKQNIIKQLAQEINLSLERIMREDSGHSDD